MDKRAKIYIAGHAGMAGSALLRRLTAAGYDNVVTRTHAELDLTQQAAVDAFFASAQPEIVFLAAGKVGGIKANSNFRADFIYQNLMIEANVIHSAWKHGVQRLLFLGSSCIYPRDCPQPIHEDYLLTGPLEQTNEPYALAKIMGVKLCENYHRQYGARFISVMPSNLYGPNDNYDLENCHVLPALICKAHEAKAKGASELIVWGSGKPRREFLFVEDMADACLHLMNSDVSSGLYNVGMGDDLPISELAELVMEVVGYDGKIVYDRNQPDGTPRKLLNIERLKSLGWSAKTQLREGIALTYKDFLSRRNHR
ncbi:GDP-L-fucose synthase family protein [Pseudomonas mosselii]|uniref:GDP-L-fucose synthase family protein n=1 Tax=Pseudomonas mosselii TaxID=78327 RepID=UPI0016459FB2|nr:GDP-L-fucose synthase [Pseudomonas mosselii]MBC3451309.1 GDP-L-fucose synthase [Pseudomonas mosselii]MBC3459145.1 GDP-L-fucose synthase [Pseudomonas mosselii]MDH1530546.1 GDP-L-fucose synthase [Pseudomonas mosselii]